MYPSPSIASEFNRRVAELVHYFLGVALVRKTICFSRSILMHDLVIGLFINRYEFGYAVEKLYQLN